VRIVLYHAAEQTDAKYNNNGTTNFKTNIGRMRKQDMGTAHIRAHWTVPYVPVGLTATSPPAPGGSFSNTTYVGRPPNHQCLFSEAGAGQKKEVRQLQGVHYLAPRVRVTYGIYFVASGDKRHAGFNIRRDRRPNCVCNEELAMAGR
jgi:hypothetical protein